MRRFREFLDDVEPEDFGVRAIGDCRSRACL